MIANPLWGHSSSSFNDIISPITTCTLDPPQPNGDNGYYSCSVEVTLNATDDDSGVKEIRYRIDEGSWNIIHGNIGKFIIDKDSNDILIEYYAIDNAGIEESINSFTLFY